MSQQATPTSPVADRPQLTAAQQAAVAKLNYVIEQPRAIALLCGPAGVGKTTVLRHVADFSADLAAAAPRTIWLQTLAELADAAPPQADLQGPDVLLVDDAHRAAGRDLVELVTRWRKRSDTITIVLAGEGRLLSLVAGDVRLEQSVRLRATLPAFSLAESSDLLAGRLPSRAAPSDYGAVIRTIHEIAGGVPEIALRLADMAAVVADADPDRALVSDDIEMIHRRLCLSAA